MNAAGLYSLEQSAEHEGYRRPPDSKLTWSTCEGGLWKVLAMVLNSPDLSHLSHTQAARAPLASRATIEVQPSLTIWLHNGFALFLDALHRPKKACCWHYLPTSRIDHCLSQVSQASQKAARPLLSVPASPLKKHVALPLTDLAASDHAVGSSCPLPAPQAPSKRSFQPIKTNSMRSLPITPLDALTGCLRQTTTKSS